MKRSSLFAVMMIFSAFALTGCQSTDPRVIGYPLPPLKTYSKETRMKVAEELEKRDPNDPLIMMIGDYGNLRKAIRHAQRRKRVGTH